MLAKKIYNRIKNGAKLAGAGAGVGWGTGYALGGNETKVPVLVKGKIKKGEKKAPTIQRSAAIGGLLVGAGMGLLKKKK
jgi:hypothetical protein